MSEIEKITSRDNRRLVHARKVRDGKIREQIFIEGRRLAEEALRSGLTIDDCFIADEFADNELITGLRIRNVPVAAVSAQIFNSISDTKQPQGIALIAKRPENSLEAIERKLQTSALPIVIFLKEINNPSNLGAILRTAEAAGAAGVIVSRDSADAYSSKALRSAMGSTFRLPIVENGDLDDFVNWARKLKLRRTATAAFARDSYMEMNWKIPRLLVFGSEAHGLSEAEKESVDELIGIPIEDTVESLNLAVSAGVILFEARRQNTSD